MTLTPELKKQIDDYFESLTPEELDEKLTMLGIEDETDDDRKFKALSEHIITTFAYGSEVYGTVTPHSDIDTVVIVDDEIDLSDSTNGIWEYKKDKEDYQFINESRLIEMVKAHHIVALEMLSLPEDKIFYGSVEKYRQYFHLDNWKLRQVISSIASNAWAKAHKKMTVEKDYDLYRGQKSLFHSLRVFVFGIQIARDGKITDYSAANKYWDEIYAMGECGWETYKEKYRSVSNALRTEFIKYCPKPLENNK